MNGVRITFAPRPDATPKGELSALTAIYRYVLLEKGGRHDLTKNATSESTKSLTTNKQK